MILATLGKTERSEPVEAALGRVAASPAEELEAWADALLGGLYDAVDPTAAPFVGAALQVYWTRLASGAPAEGVERSEIGCPLCGSSAVGGIVQGDGVRYLVCALCATEWHLPRLTCANCRSTARLSYLGIEGGPGAVKAEACEECRTYLKLFYLEHGPRAEALADDVATLPLDLLMAEAGYARCGANPFLLPAQTSS